MDKSILLSRHKIGTSFSLTMIAMFGITAPTYALENTAVSPYIINGSNTTTQTHPYMGILIINRLSEPSKSIESFCGGTLIDEHHVLTAAHCLYTNNPSQFKNLEVVFNVTNIKDDIFDRANTHAAKDVYYHSGFQPNGNFQNDIAIIKLAEPVPENTVSSNDFITFSPNENYRTNGQKFTVIGYGKTGPEEKSSDSLQMVQVEYAQPDQCNGTFTGGNISNSQLCVTGDVFNDLQSGVCGGDSGGPLLYEEKGSLYQAGIVSFGPTECGDPKVNIQSVYTEAYDYSDWIAGVLNGTVEPQYDVTNLEQEPKSSEKTAASDSGGGYLGFNWLGLLMILAIRRYLKVSP